MQDQVSNVIAIVTGAVNIAAAVFVGMQVRLAVVQNRTSSDLQQRQWDMERKRATINFLLSTIELRKALKAALPYSDRLPNVAARAIARAQANQESAVAIRSYLDYLENFSTGVNLGVLDLEVADRNGGGRIIAMFQNYRLYIERRRVELDDPRLYVELELLATKIAERRQAGEEMP
jgi:hypothetical protein